jgi:hypothetical protein
MILWHHTDLSFFFRVLQGILSHRFVFLFQGFARRGLAKINELSQLEHLSSSAMTPETEFAFRQATTRVRTGTLNEIK